MRPIMLTPEERERFAAWCEEDAAATFGLVEQMEKLPGGGIEAVAKVKRAEALAQRVVAKMLRSTQSMTL